MKSSDRALYIPERGDIVRVNFSPQKGREQGNYRPAIILSPSRYNKIASLALMCPITSKSKRFRFEVPLSDEMQTTGFVLSDHIKSFDWKARQVEFIEKAPIEVVKEVLAKVETLLT